MWARSGSGMECEHFLSYFHQNPYFGFLAAGNCISYINHKNLIFGAKLSTFTLWCQIVHGAKLSTVPNCPWCQIVHFYPWCQIVLVPNCPRCQIVRGAKLSVVPNCPLLPMVPNCPPTWAVPNCPWCQIVLVPNCPRTRLTRPHHLQLALNTH